MSPWALNRFCQAVSQGAVFGYPTDTIWGFGCHPMIADAVARIHRIKGRSPNQGFILLVSKLEYCMPFVDPCPATVIPPVENAQRPITWLVPSAADCPDWICGPYGTVAIRLTSHPFVTRVCDHLRSPLVSTSANRSGRRTVRNLIQLRRQFGSELDYVVAGYDIGSGQRSQIRSLVDGTILR